MDDSPLSRGPLGPLLGSGPLDPSSSGDSGGSGGSPSGDSDSSGGSSSSESPPSPSSSQSSTQSTPPPGSEDSAPSPPSPSLSPPPATPAGTSGSPPATPAGTSGSPPGQSSPPGSNAIPSPQAPKNSGGGDGSSESGGGSKGGGGSSGRGKGGSKQDGSPPVEAVVVGVVIGVLVFALLLCIAACVCCARRKKKKPPMAMPFYTDQHGNVYYANNMPSPWQQSGGPSDGHGGVGWHLQYPQGQGPLSEEMTMSGSHGSGSSMPPPPPAIFGSQSSFTYEELASATGGFSKANLLGQGGFGYVYKGVLPGSGKEVAVKQLKAGSGQGEREFQAEVEIISRVHHRHLVSLVGYCIAGASQRLLVYEFVANDTLERHLHGKDLPVMDWPKRLAIALGSAKGLAYLHEDCNPRIIHRDIKAANILLDENFEAKVADFGLAKLTTDNNTHVSTRVMGTFGYLAPEYASSGKLTDKSDVFSFGVMMLELITGRRPVDPSNYMEDSLVDWARPLLARALSEGGSFDEVVDQRLENKYDRQEMERMAASAAAAVRHSAKRRPKMKQIVRALEGDASLDDLNEGMKPGQSMIYSSDESGSYAANINRLWQVAFESSEEYTNEYSGTGESGETTQRHH
ncbi:hypothetical protein VPH35_078884 [Triticum aestivum]|uniref:non-specific serine/threonine protein kinase n=2 Tax=Aegilops tauschii subsp. strangulata TaxID=200361 RepID=A0A453IJR2_AEGTS|nr:proline-rich receptor-like protein kinase PERK5 [Triticum aestivum]